MHNFNAIQPLFVYEKKGVIKMKRIIVALVLFGILATMVVGCTRNNSSSSSSSSSSTSSSALDSSSEGAVEVALEDLSQAVKDAYGDDYVPSMTYDETMIAETFGLNMDNVDSFIGEGPMMSAHVDQMLIVKAKEGKGEEVEKELQAYRQKLLDNSMQYPSNLAKVNAATVERMGDYVFFFMLGAFDEREDATEDEQLTFAQQEVQKAVDAVKGFFK